MNRRLEVKVPYENVNDPSAKILCWAIPSGGSVMQGDVIAELENAKTTFEVTAPVGGIVEYSSAVDQEVSAGDALCFILTNIPVVDSELQPQHHEQPAIPPSPPPAATADSSADVTQSGTGLGAPVFSQKALTLMQVLGLDASQFSGCDMVRESDVRQKFSAGKAGGNAPRAEAVIEANHGHQEQAEFAVEETERVPLERSKILENRELGAANSSGLRSTIYYLCAAEGFREACSHQSPPIDGLSVILFETAKLLKKHRFLNACYLNDSALLYRHVHIGFAVDIDRGLKVLVIRNADDLTFSELAAKVDELVVKYSTSTLRTEDVTGSTFTVTDLSHQGVYSFEPLLNNRQAAILAIGAEQEQAGLRGFMLSCSFDHRLISGRVVAEFLGDLSFRLANHARSIQKRAMVKSPPSCSRCLATTEELRSKEAFLVPSVEPVGYICSLCFDGY